MKNNECGVRRLRRGWDGEARVVPPSAIGTSPKVASFGGGLDAAVENRSTRIGPMAVIARTQSSAAVSPDVRPARPWTLSMSSWPARHLVVAAMPPRNSTMLSKVNSPVWMPLINFRNRFLSVEVVRGATHFSVRSWSV